MDMIYVIKREILQFPYPDKIPKYGVLCMCACVPLKISTIYTNQETIEIISLQ